VIDDVMEGDRAPALSDIRGVWARLHGKNPTVNRECPDCHGTGYQIVIYKSGEGARRCPRGCVPPANDYRPEIKRELPANPILGELLAGIRAKKAVLEPKQGAS